MILTHIKKDYTQEQMDNSGLLSVFPVWQVDDFDLPELDFVKGETKGYPKRHHLDIRSDPGQTNDFCEQWIKQYKKIISEISDTQDQDLLVLLDQIWKDQFKNVYVNEEIEFTCDIPGFQMGIHFDNRNVVAVLIINLKDNLEGSTYFDQLDYTAPGKKHSGVFFLNHNNTTHSIDWQGQTDRWIGYHTLTIGDIERGNIDANTDTGR